jgi:tRNA(fMet)-specific endonuclease VapC
MPRYMLDTDTCSYVMKRSSDLLNKRIVKTPLSDVCISVITKAELFFGVEISPKRRHDEAELAVFLGYVEVMDFPDEAALHYAQIRAELKVRGTMIGANDLFIAAHARSQGMILVTNNTREFRRVPHLTVENWSRA